MGISILGKSGMSIFGTFGVSIYSKSGMLTLGSFAVSTLGKSGMSPSGSGIPSWFDYGPRDADSMETSLPSAIIVKPSSVSLEFPLDVMGVTKAHAKVSAENSILGGTCWSVGAG